MATVALSVAETAIANTATYVSYAGTATVKAFLAADFTEESSVRFENTSTGKIEVCDSLGRRLGFVGPKSNALLTLRFTTDGWLFSGQLSVDPATFLAAAPAGGVGAAAGGYDTAVNRDLLIALVNSMRAQMVARGWMKAE